MRRSPAACSTALELDKETSSCCSTWNSGTALGCTRYRSEVAIGTAPRAHRVALALIVGQQTPDVKLQRASQRVSSSSEFIDAGRSEHSMITTGLGERLTRSQTSSCWLLNEVIVWVGSGTPTKSGGGVRRVPPGLGRLCA